MPRVRRHGLTIHYDDLGDGPAVVLGHSFLCSGEMWREQLGPLTQRHRVINLDQRGHGRSGIADLDFDLSDMVDDVSAVLDDAGIESAVWCGLSIGGMVALRAALTVQERVRGLIIIDSDAGAETIAKKLKYRAMYLGARLAGLRPFVPAVARLMFGRTTFSERPELVREWMGRFASVDLASIGTTLGALMRRESVVDAIAGVDVPTLVVVGAEDRSLPPRLSRQIAERMPNASLVEIDGAGHLSALEQPEAVTDAMLGFLERLP